MHTTSIEKAGLNTSTIKILSNLRFLESNYAPFPIMSTGNDKILKDISPEFLRNMMLSRLAEFNLYLEAYMQQSGNKTSLNKASGHIPTDNPENIIELVSELIKEVQTLPLSGKKEKSIRSTRESKSASPLSIRFEGVEIVRMKLPRGSALVSLGYDPGKQLLDVEFRTGKVYRYYQVPPEVFEILEARKELAMSYFTRNVRNQFTYKELPLHTHDV